MRLALLAQAGLQFVAPVVASFRLKYLLPPVELTIFIPFVKQVPVLPGRVTVVAQLPIPPSAFVTCRLKSVVAAKVAVRQLPELVLGNDEHAPLVGLKIPLAGPLLIA